MNHKPRKCGAHQKTTFSPSILHRLLPLCNFCFHCKPVGCAGYDHWKVQIFSTDAHNITKILGEHPEFSTFNHYLTITHLAAEINRRETITVCAVDNAGMSDLLSKRLSVSAIKNVLSFHVLLDYFGTKKLHQITNITALAATVFQATGLAPGSSGFVNITYLKGGKVGIGAEDKNLTVEGKILLLEYHGVPIYQTMESLKSNNGLMNTLATDGARQFDFTVQNDGEIITLKTKIVTAKITGTFSSLMWRNYIYGKHIVAV